MGRYSILLGEIPKTRCIVASDTPIDFLSKEIYNISKISKKSIIIVTDRKQMGELGSQLKTKLPNRNYTILDWKSRFFPIKDITIYFIRNGTQGPFKDFLKTAEKTYYDAGRIVIFCSTKEYERTYGIEKPPSPWKIDLDS